MAKKDAKWPKSKGKTSKNDQKSKQKSQKQIFEGCLTPKAPKLSFPGVWVGGEWGGQKHRHRQWGAGGERERDKDMGKGHGTRNRDRDKGASACGQEQ